MGMDGSGVGVNPMLMLLLFRLLGLRMVATRESPSLGSNGWEISLLAWDPSASLPLRSLLISS